jgi:uncharacterized membrane protein (UPF0136 family)
MLIAARIALGLYALLLAGGGVMGYVKAQSRPSLIAGLASGLAALACLILSTSRPTLAAILGIVLAALMFVVFGIRLARTRKFMPSGLLLAVSLIVLGILAAAA